MSGYSHRDYPERSWSFTKHNLFNQCKRKYFYNTYGHWNGWESNCSPECRHVYLLKKLEDVYTLSGKEIHNLASQVVKGKIMNEQEMHDEVMNKLRKACINSKFNINAWKATPKNYTVLHEYYYGGNISEDLAETIKERTKKCCGNLLKSKTFKELKEEEIEILENDEGDTQSFIFNDIKIYAKLDLMYRKNNQIIIVDWKTGLPEEESHRIQMLVYYLYVREKEQYRNLKFESIKCIDEYLLTGQRYTEILDEGNFSEIESYIIESVREMDSFLEDVSLNKPKDKSCFIQNKNVLCPKCNYIEICKVSF